MAAFAELRYYRIICKDTGKIINKSCYALGMFANEGIRVGDKKREIVLLDPKRPTDLIRGARFGLLVIRYV